MPPRCVFSLLILVFLTGSAAAGEGVTVPFREVGGLIMLEVKAGEQHLAFVLDSGAEATVLDSLVAERLGVKMGRAEKVVGVTGRSVGHWVKGLGASVGGEALPDRMLAVSLTALAGRFEGRVDGLIGADFLKKRAVRIDYGRKTVTFGGPIGPGFDLPLVIRQGAFCVKGRVDGGRAGWLRIDTGCVDALHWSGEIASKKGHDRRTSVAVARGKISYRSIALTLGELELAKVPTVLRGSAIFTGEAGLLGNGLLARWDVVTIDAPGRRLILQ